MSLTTTITSNPQRPSQAPSASALTTHYDVLSDVADQAIAQLGNGSIGETDTLCAYVAQIAPSIATLGLPDLESLLTPAANQFLTAVRWDYLLQRFGRPHIYAVEAQIKGNLPPGWKFTTGLNPAPMHPLNAHLLRVNGFSGPVTGTPATATLAATTVANGGIAHCVTGSAPRVVYTLVGAADWNESLPSAECAQVAVSGMNNAYTLTISGTVPAGVTKARVYRGYAGGASGTYYWAQDTAVTAGAAFPAITIAASDSQLLPDWQPPSWASNLQTPQLALLYALAWATQNNGQLSYLFQLDPKNVGLGPSNLMLGLGNPASSGQFGLQTIGSSYAAGAIQATNVVANSVQGFAGALGVQARVVSALDHDDTTLTIGYNYYQAANGWGTSLLQTGVTQTGSFATGQVGDTVAFSIPTGRVVQSVTVTNVAGTATTGAIVLEGTPLRS